MNYLIGEVRVKKLRQELEKAGGAAIFARLHSLDSTYISQLVNGRRSFGEKAARTMERAVGWPCGYLDALDLSPEQVELITKTNALTPAECRAILPVVNQILQHRATG